MSNWIATVSCRTSTGPYAEFSLQRTLLGTRTVTARYVGYRNHGFPGSLGRATALAPPRLVRPDLDPRLLLLPPFSMYTYSITPPPTPRSVPQPDVGRSAASTTTARAGRFHASCEGSAPPHSVSSQRDRQAIGPGRTSQSTAGPPLGQTL